jgi:AcrR family transcriptional regulator
VTAAAPRRRGPRAGGHTRRLLLDVAEQLYGEQGVDAVSLRTVAATAGVASSALHYHFATGEQLLQDVLARRAPAVAGRTGELLRATADGGHPVTVAALVDALLVPWLELLRAEPEGGTRFVRLVSRLLAARDDRLAGYLVAVTGDFDLLVARLPPPASRSAERWSIAANTLVYALGTGCDPGELRDFVIAGLGRKP